MKTRGIDRRSFLKLAGAASVAGALPLVSPAIGMAGMGAGLKVAQETRIMMGTLVSVTVVDGSPQLAQDAMNQAFKAMASMSDMFDRHNSRGLVCDLNKDGKATDLPPQMHQVLHLSAQVARLSGGAFDVSVAPLVDLYKTSFAAGHQPPAASQVRQAMNAIGGVHYDGRTLRLTREGAGLTLDGVAKGFLVDQGLAAASAAGARHVLINAGGDVGVLGDRGNGRPWTVAVADPAAPTKAKAVAKLTSGALATSGNYEVYFDDQKLYHHIISPKTGKSPATDVSVSVRAGSAAMADAMATACFVMHPHDARALLSASQGMEGMILTRQGQRYVTPGFLG